MFLQRGTVELEEVQEIFFLKPNKESIQQTPI